MMKQKIPQTKEECFAILDAMLSDDEKNDLMNEDNLIIYHFSLGMWIRNTWLYQLNDEEKQSFVKMFANEGESEDGLGYLFFNPDSLSSDIIEQYVEYLHQK